MTSIARLFSACVATAEGRPEELQAEVHPEELKAVQNAVAKRRLEFIAGRTCARLCMDKLGLPGAVIPVGTGRAPLWPPGIVGSISHTRGYCGAAAARRDDVLGLGFDAECVDDVRPELWPEIVSETELSDLIGAAAGDLDRALALAFAAKESFYKCQYPLSGKWVGFHDVEMRLEADGKDFLIVPRLDIPGAAAKGAPIRGNYEFSGGTVLAGIEIPTPGRRTRQRP